MNPTISNVSRSAPPNLDANVTDEGASATRRPNPRPLAFPPTLAASIGGGASSVAGATEDLCRAAKKWFEPSARCSTATNAARAQLAADWKALAPKLLAFASHVNAAGPALARLGVDAGKIVKGIGDVAVGAQKIEMAGAEVVATEGALSPLALLQAANALLQIGRGLSSFAEGASRLPADVKHLKPHLEQLKKDIAGLAPELTALKNDAERALGAVRHECLRM